MEHGGSSVEWYSYGQQLCKSKSTTVPLKSSKGQVGQGEVGVELLCVTTRGDRGTVVSVA